MPPIVLLKLYTKHDILIMNLINFYLISNVDIIRYKQLKYILLVLLFKILVVHGLFLQMIIDLYANHDFL